MRSLSPSNERRYPLLTLIALFLVLASTSWTYSQTPSFKAGDRVEVDVNMSGSPDSRNWQKGTIVEVMMWQGKISGISVKTDSGQNMTVGERHLRRSNEAAVRTAVKPSGTVPIGTADANRKSAEFKVGDRVEVDSILGAIRKARHG